MITVIIPTCDRPARLARALASVSAQGVAPAQVVVVDNGRTPTQPIALEELEVSTTRAPVRCGAAQARNIGAVLAQSEWLAFLDDDDTWHTDYLSACHQAMTADTATRLWLGGVELLDEAGQVTAVKRWDAGKPRAVLWRNPGVVGSNVVIHRETFLQVGGFDQRLACGEDRALLWRCLRAEVPVARVPGARAFLQSHGEGRLSDPGPLLHGKAHFAWLYRREMRWRERLATLANMAMGLWVAARQGLLRR
ncbi:cell wall biosynthesis glycosyltransferase [Spiribacter salinus M19-40]|uniref:Cell wall biosynthesis glycosyltransferase n=1 Tax=Spiribacter salinus M19-40 TaxID=1260251 RepID=R4VME2_9GAMM|nr:glycosyltransferase family A protein [Spiribacter salinus]AGM41617.1 cell wall biosynthesis glycosyltransferase [Spiribacter salinus M19-40]